MSKEKSKDKLTLKEALDQLEKKHGEGTIQRLGKGQTPKKWPTYPTGIYSIDKILGGGLAKGRMIELYGGEGSGKTTLALQAIVNVQKQGLKAAYIDIEHAFNLEYAQQLGVDLEAMYFSQPDSAEQVFDIAKTLAETGEFAIVVIDSVAALTVDVEFDGDIGKSQIGNLARFLTNALRQVLKVFSTTGCTLILINQTRTKIGVVYGDPTTTPGGSALKFYATQRIHLRKSGKIENNDGEIIGYDTSIKIDKNKIYIPFQKTKVPFISGKGFDAVADIFNSALKADIIRKEKITYYFGEEKLGVGELAAYEAVLADEKMLDKVRSKLDAIKT